MQREFTEDGWKFRVSVRDYTLQPRAVRVQFYDESLLRPAVDDVFSVKVAEPKEYISVEKTVFSLGPWEWTTTEEVPISYESLDEHVEDAMNKAWDRIDEIEQSPSQELDQALRGVTSNG